MVQVLEVEGSESQCEYKWQEGASGGGGASGTSGGGAALLEGVECRDLLLLGPRYSQPSQTSGLLNLTLTTTLTRTAITALNPALQECKKRITVSRFPSFF